MARGKIRSVCLQPADQLQWRLNSKKERWTLAGRSPSLSLSLSHQHNRQPLCFFLSDSQHYSSKEGGIQLALVESNHLIISSGAMIFVSLFHLSPPSYCKKILTGEFFIVGCSEVAQDCHPWRQCHVYLQGQGSLLR